MREERVANSLPKGCGNSHRQQGAGIQISSTHLVIEMVKEVKDAILIIWIMVIHILQQLDLVQALVKVVLVILHHESCSQTSEIVIAAQHFCKLAGGPSQGNQAQGFKQLSSVKTVG